jgi:hypothetical protein
MILAKGRAIAQAVNRLSFQRRHGFAPGSVHVGFVVDKVVLGQDVFRVHFPLSISFHRESPYSCHVGH